MLKTQSTLRSRHTPASSISRSSATHSTTVEHVDAFIARRLDTSLAPSADLPALTSRVHMPIKCLVRDFGAGVGSNCRRTGCRLTYVDGRPAPAHQTRVATARTNRRLVRAYRVSRPDSTTSSRTRRTPPGRRLGRILQPGSTARAWWPPSGRTEAWHRRGLERWHLAERISAITIIGTSIVADGFSLLQALDG